MDGIRVSSSIGLNPTEEFAPNAFDFPTRSASTTNANNARPRNSYKNRDLLRKELEQSNKQIAKLEDELEEQELSSLEKMVKQNNIIEHQERAIQFRQMHLETTLDEMAETEGKIKQYEQRIKEIRSKALIRKFQSRFWMSLFILSMIEHIAEGSLSWTVKNVIMPVTSDLVFSNATVAVLLRAGLVVSGAVYFRMDKMLGRVPALV